MISMTKLAIEIYQKLGKQYPNLNERKKATKNHILTEITQWNVKRMEMKNSIFFKPEEFNGSIESDPFEVRLVYDINDNFWELKFGNLNTSTPEEQFKWNENDPFRLQKSLFLIKVLENELINFMKNTKSKGIKFIPFDGDGLGDERLSYFQNMFKKLNKNEFTFQKGYLEEDETYYIIRNI